MSNRTAAALAAQTAARKARLDRDQIEDCCSSAWRAAHSEYRRLTIAATRAFDAAYAAGEIARPYWA